MKTSTPRKHQFTTQNQQLSSKLITFKSENPVYYANKNVWIRSLWHRCSNHHR